MDLSDIANAVLPIGGMPIALPIDYYKLGLTICEPSNPYKGNGMFHHTAPKWGETISLECRLTVKSKYKVPVVQIQDGKTGLVADISVSRTAEELQRDYAGETFKVWFDIENAKTKGTGNFTRGERLLSRIFEQQSQEERQRMEATPAEKYVHTDQYGDEIRVEMVGELVKRIPSFKMYDGCTFIGLVGKRDQYDVQTKAKRGERNVIEDIPKTFLEAIAIIKASKNQGAAPLARQQVASREVPDDEIPF
jgi:hypothetical protein